MTIHRFFRLIRAQQEFLTIFMSLSLIFLSSVSVSLPFTLQIGYIAIVFSKYILTGYVKSFEFALAVALISLFLIPAALSVFLSEGEYVVLLAGAIIFAEAFRVSSTRFNKDFVKPISLNKRFNRSLWLFFMFVLVGGWHLRLGLDSTLNVFVFFAPFAASLVVLERSIHSLSMPSIFFIVILYFLATLYYSMFFWSGFGRLVISAYILMPLLVINQHRDVGLRVWQLSVVVPAILLGAFILRFQEEGYERIMEDSWSSHLTLTRTMLDTMSMRDPAGFSAYMDQFLLLFFQWVPRSVWPDKPVGVGLSFVDDWMGRGGFDLGHSIALGFMGETMWYLGSGFMLGIIMIFLVLLFIRFTAAKFGQGGYANLAIVDSFLPSFFWGGMATYGSRIWFFLIPAMLTIYILRIRFRRRDFA